MSHTTAAGKTFGKNLEKAIYDLQNGYACHKESHFVNTIQGRRYVGPGRRNMTTEYEVIKYAVYNSLGVGKKNAKTRKELCSCVKCSDRVLRKAIEDLRRDRVIITDDNGTGYYIPTSDNGGKSATEYWISRQKKRIRAIRKSLRGAQQFVSGDYQVDGQMELFDFIEDES